IATLLVASAIATYTQLENQSLGVPYLNIGAETSTVIQTFRSLGLRPIQGSRILLLLKHKIFENKWNVFFIACLVCNDHSLRIWVQNADEFTPEQQVNVDYVILFSEFHADIIQSPEPST